MDETKLNASIQQHFGDFKNKLREQIGIQPSPSGIMDFVDSYEFPVLVEEDYSKKRRVKNPIPFHEKCTAKAANGEQCSRRKKKGSEFCGTHNKARPHGIITPPQEDGKNEGENVVKKEIEVWLEDINGIMYWINDVGTVYHPDDIRNNIENPRVIAHYEKNVVDGEEVYKISENVH
ncbi:unnamed protein product [marine sediment metagenome]|uniref:Uncharacterized protein n=1 Tax=marine sediment metagenome TaxID=412755 RepID=X0SWJ5_9ZZZZ